MRARHMRPVVTCGLAALLTWAAVGAAEPTRTLEPGAPAAANARYQIGLQLYQAGNFNAAATEFRGALAMFPHSVKLAYNLGRSEERARHFAAAIEAYRTYLSLETSAEERALVERLIVLLRAQLEAEWPAVAVVTQPVGAEVRMDGQPALLGNRPVRIRLAPGMHTVDVSLAGHAPRRVAVDFKPGADRQLDLTLAPLPAPLPRPAPASAPASPPVTREVPPAEPVAWRPIAGVSGLGVGVVAAAVGTWLLVDANGMAADASRIDDAARYRRLQSDFESQQTAGGVVLGLGVAALCAGGLLLWWPFEPDAPASR